MEGGKSLKDKPGIGMFGGGGWRKSDEGEALGTGLLCKVCLCKFS